MMLALTSACDRVPEQGLVAWWKFDETSGISAADASGNGNRATVHQGGWGAGRVNGALHMNGGNNSIVIVPLSDSLRSTAAAITVSAWLYRDAVHNVDVFGHGYPGLFFGFHGMQFKWQLVNAAGQVADCYADPVYRAGTGAWYHLAASFDGSTARLYLNGDEICQRPLAGPIVMPEIPFTISGYFTANGSIMDEMTGRIDELRVYNRALGRGAIRALYRMAGPERGSG